MSLPRPSASDKAHEQACNDVHYYHDRACKALGQLYAACAYLDHDHTQIMAHLSDMLGDIEFKDVEQF